MSHSETTAPRRVRYARIPVGLINDHAPADRAEVALGYIGDMMPVWVNKDDILEMGEEITADA